VYVLGRSAPRRQQLASRCCNGQRPARRAAPACDVLVLSPPAPKGPRISPDHHARTQELPIAGAGARTTRETRGNLATGNLALSCSRGPACSKHRPSAQPHTRPRTELTLEWRGGARAWGTECTRSAASRSLAAPPARSSKLAMVSYECPGSRTSAGHAQPEQGTGARVHGRTKASRQADSAGRRGTTLGDEHGH